MTKIDELIAVLNVIISTKRLITKLLNCVENNRYCLWCTRDSEYLDHHTEDCIYYDIKHLQEDMKEIFE